MKVKINASSLQKLLNALPDMEGEAVTLPYQAPDGIRKLLFVRRNAGFKGIDQWVLEVDVVKYPKKK